METLYRRQCSNCGFTRKLTIPEIERILHKLLSDGRIEIAGVTADGEPMWQATSLGQRVICEDDDDFDF